MSITMVAPSPEQQFTGLSQTYTSDGSSLLYNVAPQDVATLEEAGCYRQVSGGGSGTPTTTIAASGASQTLAFAASGDIAYDVTLSANCAFTITPPSGTGTFRRLILIIRPNGYQATLPSSSGSLTWAGGVAVTPSTSATTEVAFGSDGTAAVLGGM